MTGNLAGHSLEAVLGAARMILPELPSLLGEGAAAFAGRLQALIDRAVAGEQVADEIIDLLWSTRKTRARASRYLAKRSTGGGFSEPSFDVFSPTSAPETGAEPAEANGGGGAEANGGDAAPHTAMAEPPNGDSEAEGARWILAQVWDVGSDPLSPKRMTRAFRAGVEHAVNVRVGPVDADWFAGSTASQGDAIDEKLFGAEAHEVGVVFLVPALGITARAGLTLPAKGPSNVVKFSFRAPEHKKPVEAWIGLIYEGRQIQAARLSGFALDDPDAVPDETAMTLQWAAIAPGLAEPGVRRPFDATVWADARGDGVFGVGVPDADALVPFGDAGLDKVVNDVRVLLRQLVDAASKFVELRSDASVGLFRELAFQGRVLYEVIGKELEKALAGRALSRIQIVQTDRVDYVPLEFVYELPTPSEDADLCEGWIERLRSGEVRCPDSNHPPADLPGQVKKVCPLGFWALTRIIERQVVKPRDVRSKDGFSIRIGPTPAQARLGAAGSAVFAFSNKLDAGVPGQSEALAKTLNGVTGDRAFTVGTWKDWASAVREERPTLMVLLSHTVDHQRMNALEIGPDDGTGSRIKLIELVPEFVKADPSDTPVVLLLGCDTAVERNDFRSFLAQFLDCGAAVVVGTIAPVLGEHAAPVAQALIKELATAMKPDASALAGTAAGDEGNGVRTFGNLMLGVRQRLLMEGELTALCMTSFGDADWGVGSANG